MAIVTGNARMFTGNAFPTSRAFELIFTPSGPAVGSNFTFWGPPVTVTPEWPSGDFSVSLVDNSQMTPKTWYVPAARWLDPAGNFVGVDHPGWQIFVTGPGDIKDMMQVPADSGAIWVGPEAPLMPGNFTGWIDNSDPVPDGGAPYYEWSN